MQPRTRAAFCAFVLMTMIAVATSFLDVQRTYSASAPNEGIYKGVQLFGDVLDKVRELYVETPDDNLLIENAINGMLSSLDPHSSYLNAKNFREMQVQTRGEFGGLGIEVTMEQGVLRVVSPIDDTPASRAGLQANDVITHLDGVPIAGQTLEQAIDKMRGRVDTPINLTIARKGSDPFDVKIVRQVIRINPIKAKLENDVVYVKISTFNEQTHANLMKQVQELKKTAKSIKGYVIDLRNNPGGLLDQAIAISDDFLERGTIVLTKGRNLEETQRAFAHAGDIADGKPVAVLINGGSASASEIVAGALQDLRRATIIGTRSFGKGSVQTIIPLAEHGALRLTTARYYTPSGRSIQARGIEPDVVIEEELPEQLQMSGTPRTLGEASLRGHLKQRGEAGGEVKEEAGSSSYVPKDAKDDKQLQYALKLVRESKVAQPKAAPKPALPKPKTTALKKP
jgi:carboxyl-terminal processing protease